GFGYCTRLSCLLLPAPTPPSPLPLHAALPISDPLQRGQHAEHAVEAPARRLGVEMAADQHRRQVLRPRPRGEDVAEAIRGNLQPDRKSTRLNSSHVKISYAVFCLKKKIEVTHR